MGVSALELRRRVLMAQPHKERKTGGIVSFNTHVPQVLDVDVPLSPVQAGTGDPYPPGGGKNKFKVTATTQTLNGITFTVNDDGTVVANGTATSNAFLVLGTADFLRDSPTKTYIINGCPPGGSGSTYNVDVQGASGADTGAGVFVSYSNPEFNTSVRIRIYNGATVNNLVFKPMIRLASESDATFAPYSNIRPISGHTGANVRKTGKNLAPTGYLVETITNGITVTPTENGIKVVGTSTGRFALNLMSIRTQDRHVPLMQGEKVTFSLFINGDISGIETPFVGYYANNAYGGNVGQLNESNEYRRTWTVTQKYADANDSYIRAYVYIPNNTVCNFEIGFQMEISDKASEYAQYSGESYPVTFPAGCVNKWDEQIAKLTNTYYGSANFIPATPLTEYYIVSPVNIYPLYYDADKNEIGHGNWLKKRTFTTPENTRYIKFYIDPAYGATYKNDISINNPASITVYIPHDQAIFGGRYEPGEGRLLIDRLSFSYTDGVNVYQSQSNRFYMLITGAKRVDSSNQSTYAGVMCDRLKPTTWAGLAQDSGNVSCSPVWGAGVAFRDDRITTVDGWKEYLAENQAQFVFELAEPLIIPLTPAEIRALIGENNVFADSGDVDVEFWTN